MEETRRADQKIVEGVEGQSKKAEVRRAHIARLEEVRRAAQLIEQRTEAARRTEERKRIEDDKQRTELSRQLEKARRIENEERRIKTARHLEEARRIEDERRSSEAVNEQQRIDIANAIVKSEETAAQKAQELEELEYQRLE